MVEHPANRSAEDGHKSHGRTLHGARLWLARACYFVLFLFVFTFFIVGFQVYIDNWNQGYVGAWVTEGTAGKLFIYVAPAGDAAKSGVLNGDELQAINGVPVATAAEANQLFAGKIGDPVTLTVLSVHQFPRDVEMVYSGAFLQLLG